MIDSAIPKPAELVSEYVAEVKRARGIGRLEAAMIRRYEHDLEHAAARGFYFDEKIANRACMFFPLCLRHTAGEWHGEPFTLSPWQAFFVWNLHGWRNASTGFRRFRKALLYVARKNGKTQLAAGLCVLSLCWDTPGEPDGQIYSAATKEEQAAILWRQGLKMIDGAPDIRQQCHIIGAKNIVRGGTITMEGGPNIGTFFKPLGADGSTQDGLNPSVVVRDEKHEWRERHRDLNEKLSTAGGARRQQLEIDITTAGSNDSTILEEDLGFAKLVLEAGARGEPADDSFFAAVYKLDDDDDVYNPDNWRKANPGLGLTPKREYLELQANEARLKPSAANAFRRYHCNLTTATYLQAFPKEFWELGDKPAPWEPEPGDVCLAAIDKSQLNDWTAVVAIWPRMIGEHWHYLIRAKFWACQGGPNTQIDYTTEPYASWIRNGQVEFSTDAHIDPAPIKDYCRELFGLYMVPRIAFDKMFAFEMAADLMNTDGLPMYEFFQTYARFEPAIHEFEQTLQAGRIYHEGCPVLAWHAGNAEYIENSKGERMFRKGRGKGWKKIDGIVGTVMAFECAVGDSKATQDDDVFIA